MRGVPAQSLVNAVNDQTLNVLSPAMAREVRAIVEAVLDERSPSAPTIEPYLSVKEAAAQSGLQEQTIRKWISQRRIKVYRAGRRVRVKLSELVQAED